MNKSHWRVKWEKLSWYKAVDGIHIKDLDRNRQLILNNMASLLWDHLVSNCDIRQLPSALQAMFQVSESLIEEDLRQVLFDLHEADMIEMVDANSASLNPPDVSALSLPVTDSFDSSVEYFPLNAGIDITYRCNYKCKHCIAAGSEDHRSELSLKEISEVVSQLAELGSGNLTLSGGEPFARDDLLDIVRIARQQGLFVSMISNGSLINDGVAAELYSYGVRKLSISLHSVQPGIHDTFVGVRGAHAKVINAIRILQENRINVVIRTSITKENCNEFIPLCKYCIDNGIMLEPNLIIFPTYQGQDNPCRLNMDHDQTMNTIKGWLGLGDVAQKVVRIGESSSKLCVMGKSKIHISSEGNIQPCNNLPIALGNVRNSLIRDVWRDSSLLKDLRGLSAEDFKDCHNCTVATSCTGFCLALNHLHTGSVLKVPKNVCDYARAYSNARSNL